MQGKRNSNGIAKLVQYSYVTFTHAIATEQIFDCIISLPLAIQIAGLPENTTDLAIIRNAFLIELRQYVLRPLDNPLQITVRAYSKHTCPQEVKYSLTSLE